VQRTNGEKLMPRDTRSTMVLMDYIVPLFQNPAQVDLRKMKSAGGASGK